jgi:hypothetical protein
MRRLVFTCTYICSASRPSEGLEKMGAKGGVRGRRRRPDAAFSVAFLDCVFCRTGPERRPLLRACAGAAVRWDLNLRHRRPESRIV